MITLEALNAAAPEDFAAALDGVFEHAAWVAEQTAPRRPFATVSDLHDALMRTVAKAPPAEIDAFLGAHPELAADTLPAGLTAASRAEQSGLTMGAADASALPALNRAYRDRFGFPFIIAVARHTPENVLRALAARLARSQADERAAALDEITRISRLRLLGRIDGPGAPAIAGHLSTHALDTALGRPAAGLAVTLLQEGRAVGAGATDADGRVRADLLPPGPLRQGPLRQGRYELRFDAGAYFHGLGTVSLYDVIPIRFRIDDAEGRYHIPILLAPFGYSTYRGS